MIRILALVIILLTVTACAFPSLDSVLSDTRTDYQKSKTLPPLDVPPDLSTTESDDSMTIPGEGTKTATLKDYENRNKRQNQTVAGNTPASQQNNSTSTTAAVAASNAVPALDADGGSLITTPGDKADVWNKLRGFMAGKGYQLDLDDLELGYMETHWSAPNSENGHTYRYKFKIYSEPNPQPGVTSLYVDNEQQEQVAQSDGNLVWTDRDKSQDAERMMAGELNVYFNGEAAQAYAQQSSSSPAVSTPATEQSQAPISTPAPVASSGQGGLAQIQDLGNNKILLAIPEEYTLAWRRIGEALQRAGLVINGSDQEKGLYHITYRGTKKDTGWTAKLKKLKFWGKDENEGVAYQVALTGVGEKTEIVILDENGGWADNDTTEKILSMIQTQYNRL